MSIQHAIDAVVNQRRHLSQEEASAAMREIITGVPANKERMRGSFF